MSERELIDFKTRIAKDYPAYWELADYVLILEQERNNYKELYEKEITKKDKLKEWIKKIQQEEFDINAFTGVCTEIRIECILDKMEDLERVIK